MKKSTIALVSLCLFWCGVSSVPLIAKADPISDILNALGDIDGDIKKGFPDAATNLNKINELNKQIQEASDDIKAATEGQFDEIKSEWAALAQSYNMGNFTTPNAFTEDAQLWSQDTWDDALKAASGSNYSRYNQLKASYAASNPIMSSSQTGSIDEDALVKNTYQLKSDTTNTGLAASQYVYDEINKHIRNINEYRKKIDESGNQNLKASMDLNSRIQTEQAQIQVEMLKLQSIQAQMQAVNAQAEVNADTVGKQFMGYKSNE